MDKHFIDLAYDYFKKYLSITEEDISLLYKFRKYLTKDKLESTGLTEDEIKTLEPSGFQLNLKNTNLAVIDIDIKADSKYVDELPTEKYNITIPESIDYKRISITNSISKYNCQKKLLLKYFTTLFDTFFVQTPNNGFHFYFINDLQPEQIAQTFGCIRSSYIKCNEDNIDVDIFLSDGSHDTFLVLPFSRIVSETNSTEDKSTFLSYSPLSFTKTKGLLKLSKIINILNKFVKKVEYNDIFDNNEYNEERSSLRNGYSRRAFAIGSECSKIDLINSMRKMYEFVHNKMKSEVKGWSSPITTFNLITSVAFLPNDAIPEVFELFLDVFKDKFSANSWKEIPNILKRCLDPSKKFTLWSPSYLLKVINVKFNTDLEITKIWFVYDTEESKEKAYGPNWDEMDIPVLELDELIKSMREKYPKLGNLS